MYTHFNIDIFGGSGFTWVVGSNQIAYFKQAMLGEEVWIDTQIIDYSEKRLLVEMRMYDKERSHLKALLWVDSIPFSLKTNGMEPHKAELMKMFAENLEAIQEKTFEERRRTLYLANKA